MSTPTINVLDFRLRRLQHLVLSCRDGRLGLLDDDLLGLTLLTLELESLTTLKLDLAWLHQLDLPMEKQIFSKPLGNVSCDPTQISWQEMFPFRENLIRD